LEEYLSLPEESPGRVMLERRFGKIFIMRLIKEREEEEANQKWLENSTMSCPKCKVHVEKSVGCNHVRGPLRLIHDKVFD
jgi:E3 ubiquitin-protein ligase RNF14